MNTRTAVLKLGRILALASLVAVAGQLALPVVAHAKSPKCFASPVPGKPGTYVVRCSTNRP